MQLINKNIVLALTIGGLLGAPLAEAADAAAKDARGFVELRNTVVNLLQALVEKGVITREQASEMVVAAQSKAETEAQAQAAQEKAEEGAVRVPYVPKVVRDEIRREVIAELAPQVSKEVLDQAQSEGWGVPGAMPDWARRVRLYGDVRMRTQADIFDKANVERNPFFIDVLTVNDRGGTTKAGAAAFSNTTIDRQRQRVRMRLGIEAELGYGFNMGARLATGTLRDPVSTNQTLGIYTGRFQAAVDQAWMKWNWASPATRHAVSITGGRFASPWISSDLMWDTDVAFDGVSANYRLNLSRDDPFRRNAFLTVGAFPIDEVELSSSDKWLYGIQGGFDWRFGNGDRLRATAAYYDFQNMAGRRNTVDSTLLDFTAPKFVQRGNSLFNIRNSSSDANAELFALASDFRVVNLNLAYDWRISEAYRVTLNADVVQNIGFDKQAILARTGRSIEKRNNGYQFEVGFGSPALNRAGAWRVALGYRYLERDAVPDAFTDSDFRLGGTDSKGYTITGDYSFTERASVRLRYLSGDSIDVPSPYNFAADVLQLDLNASF